MLDRKVSEDFFQVTPASTPISLTSHRQKVHHLTCDCHHLFQHQSFIPSGLYTDMASALYVGLGIAAAAFFGRAGLVALRRSRGGTNALGRAFYKGGFEAKMTRKEAALILQTKYV